MEVITNSVVKDTQQITAEENSTQTKPFLSLKDYTERDPGWQSRTDETIGAPV